MNAEDSSRVVGHIKIREQMRIGDLIQQFDQSGAFGAGCLAEAATIYNQMLTDPTTTVITTLAGAMVPGGMRRILRDMLTLKYTDVLITTGANLTHDLIEAFGYHHHRKPPSTSDVCLREQGISRIHNVYVTNQAFILLEERLQQLFDEIAPSQSAMIPPNRLLRELGLRINDPNSIIATAAKRGIPIFCPAITDSILGLQLMLYAETHPISLDPLADLKELIHIAFEAETTGVLIIGGGVPKNYALQSALITGKGFRYAVQLTTDHPEAGGLSGATLNEAQSWGKLDPKAQFASVIADATITLPLLLAFILEQNKGRVRDIFE
ncbi:MAG: deoxyhypusine synthase [Candidatus Heimdallarchaeota archaeon]